MKSKIRLDAKVYNRRMTEERRAKLAELLDAGDLNYFQISEIVGVSEATVNNVSYQRRKQAREQEAQQNV